MPIKAEEGAEIIASASFITGINGQPPTVKEVISYIRSQMENAYAGNERARFGCAYYEDLGGRKVPDPDASQWLFLDREGKLMGTVQYPVKKTSGD